MSQRPPEPSPPVKHGAAAPPDERLYSPGLEGVVAAESAISLVDGKNGRLIYRGYPIGQLVERGTYGEVADLLWTGEWHPGATLSPAPVPAPVLAALRELPRDAHPMDALRTAVSVWGTTQRLTWPPTPEQARALTAFAPSALAAIGRLRQGLEPVETDTSLDLAAGFLQQLNGERPDEASARALDAYFIVGAEHGLNASTFTARVITSTRSDVASAVCGAIGALKGPLHGGAPSEVVNQLHEIGSPERAEQWVRDTVARGERVMGFGHRVYRAYDPRAAALRTVAEQMGRNAEWLAMAVKVEDVVLRVLAELKPGRILKTNVEYYAAAVLQGVGLPPILYPSVFALARHAGWTAHAIEQVSAAKLIRPDMRYTGPQQRELPA
ncbi:MAG TPA: citrate/2-methylcitrate synthase [Candidatus Limnocylindria bacterium]|nr:citrate/2-methylcitrate synthase [Candidatus Limnocylindria bacterium]